MKLMTNQKKLLGALAGVVIAVGMWQLTPWGELQRIKAAFANYAVPNDIYISATLDSDPKDGYGSVTYLNKHRERTSAQCNTSIAAYWFGYGTCKVLTQLGVKR